jgi:hypothetical protein
MKRGGNRTPLFWGERESIQQSVGMDPAMNTYEYAMEYVSSTVVWAQKSSIKYYYVQTKSRETRTRFANSGIWDCLSTRSILSICWSYKSESVEWHDLHGRRHVSIEVYWRCLRSWRQFLWKEDTQNCRGLLAVCGLSNRRRLGRSCSSIARFE